MGVPFGRLEAGEEGGQASDGAKGAKGFGDRVEALAGEAEGLEGGKMGVPACDQGLGDAGGAGAVQDMQEIWLAPGLHQDLGLPHPPGIAGAQDSEEGPGLHPAPLSGLGAGKRTRPWVLGTPSTTCSKPRGRAAPWRK